MKFLKYMFDLLCCKHLNTVIEDDELQASVHEGLAFDRITAEQSEGVEKNAPLKYESSRSHSA